MVELLITIVVLSILIGIAIPFFKPVLENNTVVSMANSLLGDFLYARSEAVKREQQVTVRKRGANWGAEGWRVFVDVDADNDWNSAQDVLLKENYDPNFAANNGGVSLVGNGRAAAYISYDARGRANRSIDNQAYVRITKGDATRYICFSSAGRPVIINELNGNGRCP